jgi:SAM-dependent methyltransferase
MDDKPIISESVQEEPADGCFDLWYSCWFDENYLKLYRHRDGKDARKQVDLILKTLSPGPDWEILDLACGNGRHLHLFQERGYSIAGLDLSLPLIKDAMARFPELSIYHSDMRDIPGQYDLIVSLFTSFGYFDEDEENEKVIRGVASSLKPGGWFWLDFFNPERVKANLVPNSEKILDDGTKVTERRFIADGFVKKEISFHFNEGIKGYSEQVRLFSERDLKNFFIRSGLTVRGSFGNYEGGPLCEDSPRIILYGQLI